MCILAHFWFLKDPEAFGSSLHERKTEFEA